MSRASWMPVVVSRHLASLASPTQRHPVSSQHYEFTTLRFWGPAATLHHNNRINAECDTWSLLGSMPAIHQYMIHPSAIFVHEVTVQNSMGC